MGVAVIRRHSDHLVLLEHNVHTPSKAASNGGLAHDQSQGGTSSAIDAGGSQSVQKLSRLALTGMVVGSMVGAGIFSLPRSFGEATGPFGAIIAWIIAVGGMYTLARVFQALAHRKPDLDAGVYAYAKAGFGDYPGFLSAFGYWIGSCLGNVSYWVLIKSTLGAFFPVFGAGNTVTAIIVASIGIWIFHFTILKGIQQAASLNTVVTIAKIVPILVFIVLLIGAFKADLFRANFFGGPQMNGSSLFDQVRATMLVTVFVFLGIEGASVYSRYARTRADVGSATLLGLLGVACLLVLVTLLPYAALPRADIANIHQPSMAGVLEAVVGHWGAVFVSIGLIISVLGAYLAWSLICAEVLFSAAKTRDMPRVFATQNENKVPAAALWLTNIVVQLFVISTYWSEDAFSLMLELTSSMTLIPYLLVAGYGLLVARHGEGYPAGASERRRDAVLATIAVIYTAFLIYAGGLKFLLLSTLLYAPGTLLYFWTRREQGQRLFKPVEWGIFLVTVIGFIAGIVGIASGAITV
jgi:arginine:ornithine antiporter / lysine permease